jgi:hypothetical protein
MMRRLALLASALALTVARGQVAIESVTRVTESPERFGRTDFVVIARGTWDDPFRASDARLDLRLRSPSGAVVTVPGYFESGASGQESVWHVRYAASEAGTYGGVALLGTKAGNASSQPFEFTVAPSSRRGFLRADGPWVFRFDNGEAFRGIGENLCWESRSNDDSRFFKSLQQSSRFTYDYMLGALSSDGGTFTRIWMCPWNLPLEWRKVSEDTNRYRDDPGHFNRSAIARMDQLVETLESSGIYAMLTLETHGALLGGEWDTSNYNARNGGPCRTPAEFFTNEEARRQFKDRLRYLVARWGYSPNIGAWEFFNEVDNAMYGQKPERIPDAVVAAWHAEMSVYLKAIDPYKHLVTTSVSHRDVEGMNRIASMDFSQKHIYKRTEAIPSTLRSYVEKEGKPYVIGEFGYEWDWSKNFMEFAPEMDNDFKQGLWLGLFSPTPVLPMSWWWEFFDERKMTPYLRAVRLIDERMLSAGKGHFVEVGASAVGARTLAVRCGASTFVYVYNPGGAPFEGDLTVAAQGATTASCFEPEGRTWRTTAVRAGDGINVILPALRVASEQCMIIEVQ